MSAIANAFVSKLLDDLGALVKDEVATLWGVNSAMKRLQQELGRISTVLADAENKKIQSKAIDEWLKKLKDVMYDADDILDECLIEAEKSKVAAPSSFVGIHTFKKMSFTRHIGRKIQELNHRLEYILAEQSKFDLLLSPADGDDHRSSSRVSRKTSFIPEPDIVGSNIEKDTEKLVELLIKEDTRENILVYSIIGTGGIGKTTLARRIFNDEKITANFPMNLKLWVCVSKDFEETSLLKEIITQAGGDPGGASSRALLENMIRDAVTNKKFLLVLDDLWDQNVWNDLLRNPLHSGATGSRVLVTTRNEGVASQMKAVAPHHRVQLMSAEDGWVLLRKKVVLSGQEREIEDLKDIGKKIVHKCGCLPLFIKTIGGVLSTKSRTRKDWEQVLRTLSNNAWTGFPEGFEPALYLSYEDLPSHLKQCFLYCSLFPEDYRFHRRQLIHLWISEGFIREGGDRTLEELGEDYYGDLVQRSIFQPFLWPDPDDPGCTVHVLLWSLARFLARDENLILKDGVGVPIKSSLVKPRRLQCYHVAEEKCQEFIDALERHDSLRTILLPSRTQLEENDVNNLINKTRRLRVLKLASSKIIKMPDSLGNLLHLCYLNLTDSRISELPESIGNLVNLQFLILRFCSKLRSLPKGIGKLHNLRCLDLDWTDVEGIPVEIANCNRLNTLRNFVVRNNDRKSGWCTLKELRSLKKLRVLAINWLERALNDGEVRRVDALRDMSQLEVLEVSMRYTSNRQEDIKRMEEIFEVSLCPPSPSQLEILTIFDFIGLHYPSWIASSRTDSLRRLVLVGCVMCLQLPPLGKLPNLEALFVSNADAVKKIGTEFLDQEPECSRDQGGGRIQISFPRLITLTFEEMDSWEEWEWDDDRLIALPNLKDLTLLDCPKLRSLPSGLVHHATTLTNLTIGSCYRMEDIRGFSSVKELHIYDCPDLEVVSDLPSLKTLTLGDDEMRSLPEWFHGGQQPDFPALNKLEVRGATDELLRSCLKNGLDWPKIEHIPYVYAKSFLGSGYISKSPAAFNTNLNDHAEDPSDHAEEPSDYVEEE